MRFMIRLLILVTLSLASAATAQQRPAAIVSTNLWSQLGNTPAHASTARTEPVDLSSPIWIADGDTSTRLAFLPQSGIVADQTSLYALGYDLSNPSSDLLACFDQNTGALRWTAPVPFGILDSWSTPAIDLASSTIFVASGAFITAFDTTTGNLRWQSPLDKPVVNASPVVTPDLRAADRLFITDYSFGSPNPGALYCINIDPYHPVLNPYQPGERVWSVGLGGATSGNTTAYAHGKVFVSTANSASTNGLVHRFDARATAAPSPDWTTANPLPFGFYSGVSFSGGAVYASSYNFTSGHLNSNTLKLNANTGVILWSTPSNRTDVAPIILSDDRVLVSGGPPAGVFTFFGSRPSIALYTASGELLWDTALATHDDTNSNGTSEPGEPYLSVGGWTHLPILVEHDNQHFLYTGSLADPDMHGFYAPCTDLRLLNLDLPPTDPGFVVDRFQGAGTTPAITNRCLFTLGGSGIHSFAPQQTRSR
ncbi:MAG: PQQ-like beta-propeller repeat protein [Phycisphaerales bacterium]|nr:PQQ-like beta-propeller repeat protein [Phycisphaerales bacterium]